MESAENLQGAPNTEASDPRPKRKGRGPSMKKKVVYLQSNVCFLDMSRQTIKAREYSNAEILNVYTAPTGQQKPDDQQPIENLLSDAEESEEEKEQFLYEVNPDIDGEEYA